MATIDYLQLFPQSILNRLSTSVLGKLWTIFSEQLDEIETTLTAMQLLFSIFNQSGKNLDQIGTNVLLARGAGQSDESYRLSLSIAIAEKKSGGSIPELAEIGKIVAGNSPESVFRVDEQWDEMGTEYLDGEMLLEGTDPLNPDVARSASILSPLEGNIDDITAPLLVGDTVGRIRAAGVFAAFNITFQELVTQMTAYTETYTLLDGSFTLDSKQRLNPVGEYDIYEIALGDGATREPLPSDTGLQNEVYREGVIETTDDQGRKRYTIDIAASQLNSVDIDELAAFSESGLLVLKDVFEPKGKNENLLYNYQIIDNQNV